MNAVAKITKCYNDALNFALDDLESQEAITFLKLWREGCWPEIREQFPEFKIDPFLTGE